MGNNQRDAIKLSPGEIAEYLERSKTLTLATNGRDGWPHLIAMWYAVKNGVIVMTTYGRSQKVVNIKRDAKATIMIESETEYSKLKGLMMRGSAEIVEDVSVTAEAMRLIGDKMSGGSNGGLGSPEQSRAIVAQASKRVVIRFHPEKTASWDHSKMRRA